MHLGGGGMNVPGLDLPDISGLVGILAMVAGLRLLWQARHEILFWLEAFVRILREQLAGTGTPARPRRLTPAAAAERHTLRIVIGMFLVLFVGPFLIALGIIF
jgi:hypothetical protein